MSTQLPVANWRELALWLIRRRKRMIVQNRSMEPTLYADDAVFVDPNAYRNAMPQDEDIVVAQHPQQPAERIIKRIQFLDEQNRCYLSSDNSALPESQDSRSFWFVEQALIFGRVTSCIHASSSGG